jgi:hypothetical protein
MRSPSATDRFGRMRTHFGRFSGLSGVCEKTFTT